MIAAGIPGVRKNRLMDAHGRPMALADRLMDVRLTVRADRLMAPADHLTAPADHLTAPGHTNVSFRIQIIIYFSFLTRFQIYRIPSAIL